MKIPKMKLLDLVVLVCVSVGLCSRATASCGGNPSGDTGVFAFPGNSSDNSGSNIDCEWDISANSGDTIKLTFKLLYVSCASPSNDELQIRDYNTVKRSQDYQVTSKCSIAPAYQEQFVSKGSRVKVVFKSDSSTTNSKFVVHWQKLLKQLPVLRGCSGNSASASSKGTIDFTFPNDGSYDDNSDCSYTVNTAPGSKVKLTFALFDLEDSKDCSKDYLEIVDGTNSAGKWCGTNTPGVNKEFVSTKSNIQLHFHSDNANSGRGFRVTWETVEACGRSVYENEGAISFPEITNTYDNNMDCTWTVSTLTDTIKVTFYYVDIEDSNNCDNDYLELNDNVRIRTLCSRNVPGIKGVYYTPGNNLKLSFHSNNAVTKSGFYFTWKGLSNMKGCGGTSNENEGGIMFPGNSKGKNYDDNMDCDWFINTEMETVMVIITFYDIQDDAACSEDYLEINNNKRLCGQNPQGTKEVYYTNAKNLLLKFHSDSSVTKTGFALTWKGMPKVPGCGGRSEADTGSIAFADTTNAQVTCVWNLLTTPGKIFKFTFTTLAINANDNCDNTYLELLDGGKSKGKQCGPGKPGTDGVYLSRHNHVDFIYQSDSFVNYAHFNLRWETVHQLQGCKASVTSNEGVLVFPEAADQDYSHNKDCVWKVSTEKTSILKLNFITFDIEPSNTCSHDYLQIGDGPINAGKWCGTKAPGTDGQYISSHNSVEIKFHSNDKVAHPGFYMQWIKLDLVEGCPPFAFIDSEEGMLAFPDNKGTMYSNDMSCTWIMAAKRGYVAQLTFTFFDIEQSNGCTKDYFQADGVTPKTCGNKAPGKNGVITAKNEFVQLSFRSDSSGTKGGFRLIWKHVPKPLE